MIEPNAVTSVSTPAIRMDKPATLADYLANIARRFPECVNAEGLAKPVALARREVRAMLKLKDSASVEVSQKARTMLSERRKSQGEESICRVVAMVTVPMTTDDIFSRSDMSRSTIERILNAAAERGLIRKRKVKLVNIWEPVGTPEHTPEPEPKGISPAPIVVDVRGEVFPSIRACARHFGVSKQAVHDAVKRGRTDMIGLRKMEAAQ